MIGQTISHYRILSQLGGGGTVWSIRLKTPKMRRYVPASVFAALYLSYAAPFAVFL